MKRSVIAIPPSYNIDESICISDNEKYLNYLEENGALAVMTTAGTSQFNLLSLSETHVLNESVSSYFGKTCILGIPAINLSAAMEFTKKTQSYIKDSDFLMALYPDRFYDEKTVKEYVKKIAGCTNKPIYLHTQKMRHGIKGDWNYTADIINDLYNSGFLQGIKEEHPNLMDSYNFVSKLDKNLDIIVAGGSMRRHCFLEYAGANSFLAGIGNLFPRIENEYFNNDLKATSIEKENRFFDVFLKNGWHKSLRFGLKYLGLSCFYDRQPWPDICEHKANEIIKVIEELNNE